jgi:hypothetical protein
MKSNEEIYHEMGFTNEMMIPKHLVMTLMHKAQEEQAKNLQQADVIKSVCLHEWDESSHNVHKCTKCGKYNC